MGDPAHGSSPGTCDDPVVDVVEPAQRAAADRDWRAVHDLLVGPASLPEASVEVLDLHSDALWWLGRVDECIALRERAHALLDVQGDRVGAARMAMLLSDNNVFRGHPAIASGWLQRARRLLQEEPACLQHGCLALREGERFHGDGDLDAAEERFRTAITIAGRFDDADLEADGLQAMGRLLISMQRPAEGLANLDEAMLAAAQGRLGAFVTGKVYCSLMSACEELGDFGRAVEWSEAAARWADRHGVAVFPGLCRVHRAEVLRLHGEWQAAELEAIRACDELADVHVANAAAAYHELGEIRRRLGELDGAEAAFTRSEEFGGDAQPGQALLRLAQGRVAAAAAAIDRGLRAKGWNRLARAKLLPAQVQIALASGEVEAARAAAVEITEIAEAFASAGLRAAALSARGRIELAAGDVVAACGTLEAAVAAFQVLEAPYEVAVNRVLLGQARREAGDEEGAGSAFGAASDGFARLGAAGEIERTAELQAPGQAPCAAPPAGLTARECQVLRLVATGLTNREVAAELFLSEKTVARHLSNIFTKTGVSSRAGATAYAFERGVVQPSAHG
jgi:DNA-binding CsgD family transcriptional regulator/tetratricopeptide (TPR) repeat protein